jgi:transposase
LRGAQRTNRSIPQFCCAAPWIASLRTGGKHRPGRISKQGDRVLRALLISGASAHLRQQKARGVTDPWLRALLARRPYKLAMVAFAAKTARIVWAMLVKGEHYRDRASASAAA